MPRGPRNLRISCDGDGLTAFGGVALLHAFFRRLGLRGQVQRWVRFSQRNADYSVGEMIEALLYPLLLGLGRVETTEPLRRNGVFQYLAGLPRYPEATTLRRFLGRLATRGRDKLLTLHDHWRRQMLDRPRPVRSVILDLDTTVLTVYGRQEGAAVGFNPKKRGRPSYVPLLGFEGQTGDALAGSYHPGNTHPSTIVEPLLEEAFGRLPGGAGRVRVRADGAFYDHAFIEQIEARRAFYVVVARVTPPLRNRLGGLRYRRIAAGVWAGEFPYCPLDWRRPRRFVVIRRPVPEEPSVQLHLFQMRGYTYQLFVTNLALKALNLWRFYNRRATAELIIRELKDAYALGKIPTQDFAANEMFFQLVLLAYNLLNWFKRLCAPPAWQRSTLGRLRQRLLVVPAHLTRPGGVPTLRIAPGYVHGQDFVDIRQRIQRLQPFADLDHREPPAKTKKREPNMRQPKK